jgi:hypothetical protein
MNEYFNKPLDLIGFTPISWVSKNVQDPFLRKKLR